MKTLAFLVAALLAGQTPQSTAPTTLRRTLTVNATDTYKIEDKVQETVRLISEDRVAAGDAALNKGASAGEIPVTLSSKRTLALRVTQADSAAGTAKFEATTHIDEIKADGPAAGLMGQKPADVIQTGKLDVRGRMTYDPATNADPMSSLLGSSPGSVSAGIFVEFPERPVRTGDTWNIIVPKNPLVYDQDQSLKATLVGDRVVDGTPVWVVSIRGVIHTTTDSTKSPGTKAGTGVKVNGEVDLTGEGLVDKTTGRTLQMTSKGVSKATVGLVELGITLDATGTIDSTAKLQK